MLELKDGRYSVKQTRPQHKRTMRGNHQQSSQYIPISDYLHILVPKLRPFDVPRRKRVTCACQTETAPHLQPLASYTSPHRR